MSANNASTTAASAPVLVIDEDCQAAEHIARFVEQNGIRTLIERNSFAGVNTARRIKPAVVLMAVQLPGLDGVTAARLIARRSPGTKIILMSGQDSAPTKPEANTFAVLEKPLPLPAVLDFIRRTIV